MYLIDVSESGVTVFNEENESYTSYLSCSQEQSGLMECETKVNSQDGVAVFFTVMVAVTILFLGLLVGKNSY